jgi:hypothetical protein
MQQSSTLKEKQVYINLKYRKSDMFRHRIRMWLEILTAIIGRKEI